MLEVKRQLEVTASPDDVWAVIGDFGKIAEWHPACSASSAETVQGEVQRTIVVGDGGRLVERLEELDETNRSYSYSILEGPLPVKDYLSKLSVEANGEGSMIRWSGKFNAKDVDDERAESVIAGIYDIGLAGLEKKLG